MIPSITLSQLAAEVGGHLEGEDLTVGGATTDSRSVQPGEVFFCLRGEKFDGHDFAAAALAGGAGALVADTPIANASAATQLIVPDTCVAYGALARLWRQRFSMPVVGVTGSNGKTTVKQMLAAVFSAIGPVHATRANDNNEIGVPHTLLGLRADHQYCVVEMGANMRGEMARLAAIVEPDVALITNVSASHLEGFGSLQDVAQEKAAIYAGLSADGVAVINADDAFCGYWKKLNAADRQMTFGRSREAQLRVEPLTAERIAYYFDGRRLVGHLPLPGLHSAMNAAAACAAALAAGLTLEQAVAGIAQTQAVAGRLNFHPLGEKITLIDDTYNANPASMRAAIDVLCQASGTRIAVLGDMRELGDQGVALHAETGEYARSRGVDQLFVTGELSRHTAAAFGEAARHCSSTVELAGELERLLIDESASQTTVLVKGSRSMHMEGIVARLLESASSLAQPGVCT